MTESLIWTAPTEFTGDDTWTSIREEILTSLRKDAEGLPMGTAQLMLMERLATFYTVMRKREADAEGSLSLKELKEASDQWLKMQDSFYKQLTVGEDKRRSAMINTILSIVTNAVSMIEDERTREDLRKRLTQGFAEAGL